MGLGPERQPTHPDSLPLIIPSTDKAGGLGSNFNAVRLKQAESEDLEVILIKFLKNPLVAAKSTKV